MKKHIYKILPYWVNYTSKGLADWEGGRVNFLSIHIKPEYKSDISLLMHEVEHVKQTYKTCFLHAALYAISKRYKLHAECEAFVAGQLKYQTMTIEQVASDLHKKYDLGYDYEYILNYLKRKYDGLAN